MKPLFLCFGLLVTSGSMFADVRTLDAQVVDVVPNPPLADCYLDCGTNGLHVVGPLTLFANLAHGEKITICAQTGSDGLFHVQELKSIGHFALAAPPVCSCHELSNRHYLPTAIRGTVQSAVRDETDPDWNWMALQTAEGKLSIAAKEKDFPLAKLRGLIDAEVLLRGYPKPLNTWREGLGQGFVLLNDFRQETTLPPPLRLALMPNWTGRASPHRQRVRGKVIATDQRVLYLRGPSNAFCEVKLQSETKDIAAGDIVGVGGFVESRPDGLLLTEAVFLRHAHENPDSESVSTLSLDQLFSNASGHKTISHKYFHHLVRLNGRVLGHAGRSDGQRVILLGDDRHSVEVDFSGLPSASYDKIRVGCTISVTGLCLADVDYNQASPANLHFRSFSILPRGDDDMRILSYPSWWTPARLLVVIGILLLVLAAILIWNRTLKILSERRGRALFKEQIAHATAELRTSERTRLAVEIHDSLSQNLSGVALQISAARIKQGPDPAAAARHLETAERMLRSSRTELRRCLWDLREEMLDEQVFANAIAKSVDPVSADATVDIRFNVPRQRLTDMSAHAILCIIRELVSNAVAHGNATHVRIAGESHDDEISFSVTDNGSGFDTDDHPGVESGHFGLDGIRERVRRLHGTLTLESQAGKGTRAVVRIRIIHPSQDTDATP